MSTRARRAPAGDGLFIVGLVGRAGSGKSAVAGALAADGATVIEADGWATRSPTRTSRCGPRWWRNTGPTCTGPMAGSTANGSRRSVFRDPAARARLDRLVHPRLVARIVERLDGLRARGTRGVVVLDAALLLEWGLERGCDAVIAVTAPPAEQVRRLVRSRGWTEAEARSRLMAQRTDEAFCAAADVTLDNSGSIEELARAARAAVAALRAARPAERG